jgi:virulence factor Mce-like protein
MRRRAGAASLVASPVLVGSVTVLIAVIAVFIAYNANRGLPFVPTYDLEAELPSGGKLVKGNEVRTGGFRVGVVQAITPKTVTEQGKQRSVAVVKLKLDKVVEPLSVDTRLRVRPRSALGLKYVELTPGHARQTYVAGDTIPLGNGSEPLDLEDVFSTFQPQTREDIRSATAGFGDAFTGRGQSLNTAIEALNPFFRHLTPVMRALADPDTQLDQFFRQLGRASAQVAPVAHTNAVLFSKMADTFAAISRDPAALQATIEKSPPTEDVAIRSFRVQRPFLADFADLSRRLRPAVQQLPASLPPINSALRVGTRVLPKSVRLSRRLRDVSRRLEDLFANPNTLLSLKDLTTALTVMEPAVGFITPYQLVCNDAVYWFHGLSEHMSNVQTGPTGGGTVQQQGGKLPNTRQANNTGTTEGSRVRDLPPNVNPIGAKDAFGSPIVREYVNPYPQAVDAQGNADCGVGQFGFVRGPASQPGGRYGRGLLPDGTPSGGNWPVNLDDWPILSGPTNATARLGINNLRDIP